MKVAVIAPIKELGLSGKSQIQMALVSQLSDERYSAFYRERSKDGDYVMLDNSTYEDSRPASPQALLTAGVLADEIAVPDKLGDCEETLRLAGEAFDCWSSVPWRRHVSVMQPRFILTPQGRNMDEWRTCLFGLMLRWHRFVRGNPELHQLGRVTLGLSTKVVSSFGVGVVDFVLEHFLHEHQQLGHDIHLWGVLGGFKLWDLNRIAREFPWVRSVDTSKPIVYAMHHISLDPLREPEPPYPGRPADFFSRTLSGVQYLRAVNNILVLRRLAKGGYARAVGYEEVMT